MRKFQLDWKIGFLLATIVSIVLCCAVRVEKLKGLEGPLAAGNLAVAVFSINLSIIGYQLSVYRHFYRGITESQTLASVGVLALGVAAYFAMAFNPSASPVVALGVLPLLTTGSVALLTLAKHETSGEIVLSRLISSGKLYAFLTDFAEKIKRDSDILKKISLSKPENMPMHEWDWKLSPRTEVDDPFDTLAAIGAVAVKNNDLITFEKCVEIGLRRMDQAIVYGTERQNELISLVHRIRTHSENALWRLWVSVRESDKSGAFARKLQDLLARYVITKAEESKQCSDEAFFALGLMGSIAKHALNDGDRSLVLAPIVVSRQITQKGIDEPPTTDKPIADKPIEEMMFRHHLPQLTNVIKSIGHETVDQKDTDILYRCLDAFGWLGCSAMKKDNHEVGRACLRALSQLGRESRAAKLECFWSRCALEPWQHAEERIGWILSWVFHLPNESHDRWLRSIAEAYSRLHGFKTTIKVVPPNQDNKAKFEIVQTKEPYKWGINDLDGNRTIDYSDVNFLKDWELY